MRIHLLTLSLRVGGGGSHQNAILFIRALRSLGHSVDVHVLLSDCNDPPQDISIVSEKGEGSPFFHLQRLCADAMKRAENDSDVFLVYGQALVWGAGMYRVLGGKRPVAAYLDSHLDSMKESYRYGYFHRFKHLAWEKLRGIRTARHTDLFIAVSPYLKWRYTRAGFPKEKFVVVPNAFQFSKIVHTPTTSGRTIRMLYTGRLSFEKGVDTLIDACARLASSVEWQLRIVGDGPARGQLEKQIATHKLSDKIQITGWKDDDDVAREYGSADIFILPSRLPEPFGRSVVEALHAELPVVVPQEGGAAWVAGGAGITFQNDDPVSLSRVVEELIRDPAHRKALARNAPAEVQRFDAKKVGTELALALRSLLI